MIGPHIIFISLYFDLWWLLILIFTTHFLQAQLNRVQLPCGLNSCILLYSFKHGPSPCDILGKIEEMWFGGYESVSFRPFAWAQPMRATKWVRGTNSISGSWKRSYTWNFHLKTTFILWLTMAQIFCPNPFFLLKIIGFH